MIILLLLIGNANAMSAHKWDKKCLEDHYKDCKHMNFSTFNWNKMSSIEKKAWSCQVQVDNKCIHWYE